MPGSQTVTMTTDITSQKQHLGCLCGLKWHRWRLALASCGYHNVPILCWLVFCFISSAMLLKGALPTVRGYWVMCTLCMYMLVLPVRLRKDNWVKCVVKHRREHSYSMCPFNHLRHFEAGCGACIILCDLNWCQSLEMITWDTETHHRH